jgi:L-fuculose-phosphate aldolase
MKADNLLLVDGNGCILDGKGELSRSWPTHVKIYQSFPEIGAVIHAHPKLATAFACREKPMEPFLDAMRKYGPIPVLPRHLPVDSPEFGQAIVDIFHEVGDGFIKHGHAVFYPFHGILVAGPALADAYDLLERTEFNAAAIINSRLLME